MELEPVQYIKLFRKWFWLVFLGMFLAGGVSFIIRNTRPPSYQAKTTILIGSFIDAPNPDESEIRTGLELAQTYAELVTTYDVLQATVDAFALPLTTDQLSTIIDVNIVHGTSLLELVVTYPEPALVADIANGIAAQLILNSPTNLTSEQETQISFLNSQIESLNQQLQESRLQLDAISARLESSQEQSEIDNMTVQYNATFEQINWATSTIAQFSNTIATLQQRTNSVEIVERARIPTTPSGAGVVSMTVLGAAAGAILAGALVLLIEYFDNNIRVSDEVTSTLALPVLASIVRFGNTNDEYPERLITRQDIQSSAAEGYRKLRTNLLFAAHEGQKRAYVITSPNPGEGKSVTVSNLAVTLAQAGLQVLLIDADLRRPTLHEVFGVKNEYGLTTLLLTETSPSGTLQTGDFNESRVDFRKCLQETAIPRLRLISSGFIPANPTEILGSALMQRWTQTFLSASNVDIVLIDTPPCLVVADSSIITVTAEADVIMVLEAGRTRRSHALKAKEQILQVGGKIKGVVLNGVNPRDDEYGYGYEYYYLPDNQNDKNGNFRQFLDRNRNGST